MSPRTPVDVIKDALRPWAGNDWYGQRALQMQATAVEDALADAGLLPKETNTSQEVTA